MLNFERKALGRVRSTPPPPRVRPRSPRTSPAVPVRSRIGQTPTHRDIGLRWRVS